ncbi:MAG TPA: PIG-L family deacetylase [Thermoanaerobaculia bacterium]
MKRLSLALAASVALASAVLSLSSGPGAELPPPSTGGMAALEPALQKLSTNKRILVVGAHPDDENTALLALVARGMGGEAAYLSLSRGEGGQNLIGDELGVGLGLIRSQELAAARRRDGARQYFTRAYDFGFSKSLSESLHFWPKEEILKDAVRIIRRFRPQVVFATFTGTDRDGHGQHQESGVVAREAYRLAGDPKAYPELASEGLAPWTPTTLVRSNWFDDTNAIRLETGGVDPLSGYSYNQIAMASRSLHRSQEMGRIQPAGPSQTGAIWEAGGDGGKTRELFAAIETRLRGIAAPIADAGRRKEVEDRLIVVEGSVESVRRNLTPDRMSAVVPELSRILAQLRAAREGLRADLPGEGAATAIIDEKIAAAQTAVASAAGVTMDALSDAETAAPGEGFAVTVQVWNSGREALPVRSVALRSPDGWNVPAAPNERKNVDGGTLGEWKLSATVPAGAPPTLPYFLKKPLQGALYDWSDVPASVRGEPFQPSPLIAAAELEIAGTPIRLEREVTYRYRDEEFGEIRHALRAVPPLEVTVEPDLIVWPVGRKSPATLQITVTSNSREPVSGSVEIGAPPDWKPVAPKSFSFSKKGEKLSLDAPLAPKGSARPGQLEVPVAAVLPDGRRFAVRVRLIDYEHIRPTPIDRPSRIALTVVDLKLPRLTSVGYVRGAADRVPEALTAIGVPISVLTPRELEHGDLSRYDAILIGSRAYETEPALAAANHRILDYVRHGGLVIVQYQQYPFVDGQFAPDKIEISRPHDRVSDETAAVRVLDPSHPIFTRPNRIGPGDWDGWVQERGLYFAHSWGNEFQPLLSMNDPNQPEQRGGLLIANVGEGRYVYTGLAFFRQLPAGVPGAYRLFANLLAWKKNPSDSVTPNCCDLTPR